jgi:quinoprotein glucose dehydrogenase
VAVGLASPPYGDYLGCRPRPFIAAAEVLAGAWTLLVIVGFVIVRVALNSTVGQVSITTAGGPVAGWAAYGGDLGGSRYSPLEQINRDNVAKLEIAWEYHTGDFSDESDGREKTSFQATPILAEGVLYVSTVSAQVIALDPETGIELWKYDPGVDTSVRRAENASRGVAIWSDGSRNTRDPCRRRIFIGTIDARLISLDGATGRLCDDFGQNGVVDLSRGAQLGEPRVDITEYGVTSPPAIIEDLVIVGSAVGDNRAVTLERGIVRAFDVRTGELRWLWDPIPRNPSDPAWVTWEDDSSLRTGAANIWAQISVDPERDLVFVPTSSPSPDYYGGARRGSNSYADSVVALRGTTGEAVWHFQTVHHNLWDYDLPAQPTLITVRRDGQDIPAVAQATKTGFLFILDRDSGEPIFPVEERPVPQSDVPGEESWPTQPFPMVPAPLAALSLSPDDAWGLTAWDRGKCRALIEGFRNEGIFTPPSFEGTIVYPGNAGGTNWGSLAFDQERRLVVLNMMHLPFVVKLIPCENFDEERAKRPDDTEFGAQLGAPVGMSRAPLFSPIGLPCNKPPWGTIVAVDLNTGKVKWKEPLGTIRDLAPVPLPMRWGVPNMGGPIITAGGLVSSALPLITTCGHLMWKPVRSCGKGNYPPVGRPHR